MDFIKKILKSDLYLPIIIMLAIISGGKDIQTPDYKNHVYLNIKLESV